MNQSLKRITESEFADPEELQKFWAAGKPFDILVIEDSSIDSAKGAVTFHTSYHPTGGRRETRQEIKLARHYLDYISMYVIRVKPKKMRPALHGNLLAT